MASQVKRAASLVATVAVSAATVVTTTTVSHIALAATPTMQGPAQQRQPSVVLHPHEGVQLHPPLTSAGVVRPLAVSMIGGNVNHGVNISSSVVTVKQQHSRPKQLSSVSCRVRRSNCVTSSPPVPTTAIAIESSAQDNKQLMWGISSSSDAVQNSIQRALPITYNNHQQSPTIRLHRNNKTLLFASTKNPAIERNTTTAVSHNKLDPSSELLLLPVGCAIISSHQQRGKSVPVVEAPAVGCSVKLTQLTSPHSNSSLSSSLLVRPPISGSSSRNISSSASCVQAKSNWRPSATSATTNSRVRQGALYARRQYHITPQPSPAPTSSSFSQLTTKTSQQHSLSHASSSSLTSSCLSLRRATPDRLTRLQVSKLALSAAGEQQQRQSSQSMVQLARSRRHHQFSSSSSNSNNCHRQSSSIGTHKTSSSKFSLTLSTSSLSLAIVKRVKPSPTQVTRTCGGNFRHSDHQTKSLQGARFITAAAGHSRTGRGPSTTATTVGSSRLPAIQTSHRDTCNRSAAAAATTYTLAVNRKQPTTPRSNNTSASANNNSNGSTNGCSNNNTGANNSDSIVNTATTTIIATKSTVDQLRQTNENRISSNNLVTRTNVDNNNPRHFIISKESDQCNSSDRNLSPVSTLTSSSGDSPPPGEITDNNSSSILSQNIDNSSSSQPSSGFESADDQMILGSPLVTPPPSELDDVEDENIDPNTRGELTTTINVGIITTNRIKTGLIDNITPPPPLTTTTTIPAAEPMVVKDNNVPPPLSAPPSPTTVGDLIVVDMSIRTEPIGDYYDLEARPFARGKFAQVKRCINKSTKQCFAAKCIKKRSRLVDIRHEILLEIEALKLSYYTDRIVKLYEVYETPTEMILILEMANGGELQRVIDDEEVIDERIVKRMVRQILEGLMQLHDNDIAHLDIKPQNLLLTETFPNGDVKLCDFGISRRITKDCEIREICGTPDYVAPEILRYDPISLATDMWSLGVLTYVLLSGYSPFGSENKQQTFCNITQAPLDFPSEIFDNVSKEAIDFMQKLIVREPSERLTSRQARNHTWLKQ